METIRKHDDLVFHIDKEFANKTIHDFFNAFHLSRKTIHLFTQNKAYTLNGQFVPNTTLLKDGDWLQVKAYEHDDGMYVPGNKAPEIVFEDDYFLVVNKPNNLPVFPSSKDNTNSLSHQVSFYYHSQGYDLPVRFIHRLDDETGGLVIYVKCTFLQPLMDYLLSIKAIHRHYLALVEGNFPNHKEYTIDKPIARNRHDAKKMRIGGDKQAITHYHLIENYEGYALIECELFTGRRHQIRVHLAAIGHPLLGDPLYNNHPGQLKRQALHAYLIEFIHPITKEAIRLTSPLPADIAQYVD